MLTRIIALIALATLLCSSMALAAPTKLSQQGRLLDGDGAPLTGGHGLAFTLHDAETDGNEVWREERVVPFEDGYYSIVLGTVTPLEDLLFAGGTVWMQLSVDGVELSPRHEIVSVPYALRSAVAESVEGGAVDADEVAIGGSVVIDSSGNWLGTPTDWSELTGVPADLSDGDADTDTLLGLPCADGFIAKYSTSLGAWDCALDNDILGGLSCQAGEIPVYEATAALWVCGADIDTDTNTQLTEAEVDAFVANNGYSTGDHIVDTNTQLTNAEVAAAALAEGFVAGAHTVDTNTQLTSAQVAATALAEGFVTGAHTVDTNTQLTSAQVAATALAEGFVTGAHTVDTDTQLTEAQVDAMVANNGYLAPDSSGNVGIGTTNPTEVLTVAGTVESSSGGFKFPDGTTQASAAAGGAAGTLIYTRCAWTGDASSTIGSCTPPTCPGGWTDLAVIGNVKTSVAQALHSHNAYAEAGGYSERSCFSATPAVVLVPRCSWTGNASSTIGSCTPPSCPNGWADLGITGNVKTSVAQALHSHNAYAESGGYQERTCTL
jgi:hypothetical protein